MIFVTDTRCYHCGEPVLPAEHAPGHCPSCFHLECWIRATVGSLGHQQGRCACFGGTADDPPGHTRREAARAAWDYHRMLQTRAN
jgi:hypothetical protein